MKPLLLVVLLCSATILHAQSSTSYSLMFGVFDSGGSGPYHSTSTSLQAHSLIAQTAQQHTSSSASFVLSSGAECMFSQWQLSTAINPSLLPRVMRLFQNYPNPFNPSTTIRFVLERRAVIELAIYNLLGEKMIVLTSGIREAGEYSVDFDAASFTSGVYVYRLSSEYGLLSRRLMLLR